MSPSPVRPTFVLLHALGGSAQSWEGVCARLSRHGTCLALDLPGFGAAADRAPPASTLIDATLGHLEAAIASQVTGPWILVGHSMGGKYATLIAARKPVGLAGVVLITASPPSPEPIDEARRRDMLTWVVNGPIGKEAALSFLAANSAGPLPQDVLDQGVVDLGRTAPQAWSGWLTEGVSDDRSGQVPVLDLPAFILAGAEDGDLGIDSQRALNLPFYANGVLRVIDGVAHLIPQERPAIVAAYILALWHKVQILNDDTLDPVTRRRLLNRLDGPAPLNALSG